MYFGIANEIKSKKKKKKLSGCALPLNRDLSIYFFDTDFLKLFFFFAQKKVLWRKERKKSPVTCLTWKLKTVRIPRKMKHFMVPAGIKL